MGSPWLGFVVFFTLSLGLGLPLFFLAMFSGQLEKLPRSGGWMIWVRKLMGWVLIGMAAHFIRPLLPGHSGTFLIASLAMRGPGVTWQPYTEETLVAAQNLKKPVIIDFSATWCTPCRELEEITFHAPDVVRLAEKNFVMVKVDVTKGGNPYHEELLKKYDIKGVPTIVFVDADGNERPELRLVDFLPADQFLLRMQAVAPPEQ